MAPNSLPDHLDVTYTFTADQADPQGRMPVWLVASRVIEVATLHANALGIGYAALEPMGIAWVLSRLSIEIDETPRINEDYTFHTWIANLNRHFSDRMMTVTGADGRELMRVRTTWVALDLRARTLASLDKIDSARFPILERECAIEPMRKVRPLGPEAQDREYTFVYDDIDVNGHVNTVQYVRLVMNQWPLDWHAAHAPARFDIAFQHECRYGETVTARTLTQALDSQAELGKADTTRAITAAIRWH